MCGGHLHCCGAGLDAASSAVETYAVPGVPNDRIVDVRVVNDCPINLDNCGVIAEVVSNPSSAIKSFSTVSETVVDPAVEAYFGTPVAGVPGIATVVPAPVSRSPEQAGFRSFNPCSGGPIITVVSPSPVAWRPNVVRRRANGLLVYG